MAGVNVEAASVGYAIFNACVKVPCEHQALNEYLYRSTLALERCPPQLRPELEGELMGIADRLGLLRSDPDALGHKRSARSVR